MGFNHGYLIINPVVVARGIKLTGQLKGAYVFIKYITFVKEQRV